MGGKLLIIMFSTLLPSAVVGYVLRTNGKTINFAIIGATVVYVVSVLVIYGAMFFSDSINMPVEDLVLILPIAIPALFYFLLRGSKMGNEK